MISFPVNVLNQKIFFSIALPDAIRVNEVVQESADSRVVALQISDILLEPLS